jgi:hypothetical protein
VDAATGVITTVAGGGTGGDGGPAVGARLAPCDLALDPHGNLFVSDGAGQRVRRVDAATGIITTVAGDGTIATPGMDIGDGGPATSASLWAPCGLALDALGNLYIADGNHDRVRRVDASTGIITTVAGGGSSSGEGVPATSAFLSSPTDVELDGRGNLLIAEPVRNRIRSVDAAGAITTVAGTGVSGFGGDGGPATEARLALPLRIAVGGSLFIADTSNGRVRRVLVEDPNAPPLADAGPDLTLLVGEAGTFDGAGSEDADGTIDAYAWDFGDGAAASGAVVQHAYATGGTFTATLAVTDDAGATASDGALVTVLTRSGATDLLASIVEGYNLQQGISNSLDRKLELVRAALEATNAGQRQDAANKLQAFLNEVEAQRGNALTDAQADELVGWANRILGAP